MGRMQGIATVAALTLGAGVALADEASGKVERIDLNASRFTVGDKTFQWSSENSMGVKLDEHKGDGEVKVMYEPNQDGTNDVMDVAKTN